MPKVTAQYRSDRRAEITAAASRCFVTKGVHQTSMADIINESGLSAGAIYNHFRSKDEILVSVAASLVQSQLLRTMETFERNGETPAPSRIVEIALTTIGESSIEDGTLLSTLIIQFWAEAAVNPVVLGLMQDQMRAIKKGFFDPLQRWARTSAGMSGRRATRWAEETIQLLISIMSGYVIQRNVFPDFDERSYVRTAVATIRAVESSVQ
ncbi:TetR/AcrR family transcriptional regulator [Microlunatus soli]|uniref:DNA-binding transcriptional regulator, AcrR family n=1 Tax=Microlunatus soli TaxID=630515 RepID=A0A1H1ZAA8_9ACTN|nr:TetR/AcrR family transcriptional regulator [Microlunatus soli]SDT30432.1 DNA-binding transcriptional regulator, AcrR family [Microlunatus soli]